MPSYPKLFSTLFIITFPFAFRPAHAQSEKIKSDIQINVSFLMIGNDDPPTRVPSYIALVPVGDGSALGFRGSTGPRSCGTFAVLFNLVKKKQEAIQWLIAGQDHNQEAKKQFADYPDFTLNFLKDKFEQETINRLEVKSSSEITNEYLIKTIKTDLPVTREEMLALPRSMWEQFPEDKKIPKDLFNKLSPEAKAKIPDELIPYLTKK
ncbi:hypothetical protein [Dyadobacter bucti]|uniref:hypothetical protein n=1 Tax=Dyadobacter bucti TaxID=2572203 RepID=UPI001107F68A|nr:hypothetical protein [Dyadobacter bucti]